jgi:hypothetical protein
MDWVQNHGEGERGGTAQGGVRGLLSWSVGRIIEHYM